MIHHPKHVILLELAKAGVPNDQLHTAADRIAEAYDDANREWPGPARTMIDMPDGFGGHDESGEGEGP